MLCRAAARVAVELCEDDAGDMDGLIKGLGHIDGLLPQRGVCDKKNLGGVDLFA